jgi:hypothetical protein
VFSRIIAPTAIASLASPRNSDTSIATNRSNTSELFELVEKDFRAGPPFAGFELVEAKLTEPNLELTSRQSGSRVGVQPFNGCFRIQQMPLICRRVFGRLKFRGHHFPVEKSDWVEDELMKKSACNFDGCQEPANKRMFDGNPAINVANFDRKSQNWVLSGRMR